MPFWPWHFIFLCATNLHQNDRKNRVSKFENLPGVCFSLPPKAIRVGPKMKKDRGLSKRLLFIKKIFHPKLTHTGSVGKGMKASPSLITPPENPVQGAKPSHIDFRYSKKFSWLRESGKTWEKLEFLLCHFGHEKKYFYVPKTFPKTAPKWACQNFKIGQGFASPDLQKQFGLGQKWKKIGVCQNASFLLRKFFIPNWPIRGQLAKALRPHQTL